MSIFRKMTTSLKDEACLKAGLENLGYKPVITGQKQEVRGHGSEKFKADIVLKKEDTKLKGDIGFNKTDEGTYNLVYDTYVIKMDSAEFIDKVSEQYLKKEVAKRMSKMQGYKMIQEKTVDGAIQIRYRKMEA